MDVKKKAIEIGDRIDCFIGNPFTVVGFIISLPIMFPLAGVDITNIYISIVTALILFFTAAAGRADRGALQKKLDELIRIFPEARDELRHSERLTEEEQRKLDNE